MCQALRHHLRDECPLTRNELAQTVLNVLIAATAVPPDGYTMVPQAAEAIRLALTVMKQEGWQHANLGGDGQIGDLFEDRGTWGLYSAALAPTKIVAFFGAEHLPTIRFTD